MSKSLTDPSHTFLSLSQVFLIQLVVGASITGTEFLKSLFAGKHLRPLTACVALDEAAPLEFTVALPHFGVLVCVVAPAAAHEVAAICVW